MSSIKSAHSGSNSSCSLASSFTRLTVDSTEDVVKGHQHEEDQLEFLMDEYIYATQFQTSLRKRIDAILRERERKAKGVEEAAEKAFEEALANRQRTQAANALIIGKLKQAEEMGLDTKGGGCDPIAKATTWVERLSVDPPTWSETSSAPPPARANGDKLYYSQCECLSTIDEAPFGEPFVRFSMESSEQPTFSRTPPPEDWWVPPFSVPTEDAAAFAYLRRLVSDMSGPMDVVPLIGSPSNVCFTYEDGPVFQKPGNREGVLNNE